METKFNINNYVKVKLTGRGRKIHRDNFEALLREYPNAKLEYEPPQEDAEGWSKWQLHDLMFEFGSHVGTNPLPFEVEIIICG